jgi:uncharacterized membrane protein (DUF485 family)
MLTILMYVLYVLMILLTPYLIGCFIDHFFCTRKPWHH